MRAGDPDHLEHWESMPENKPFMWSDDAIASINSRLDAPLSLSDHTKDSVNGGVTEWFQTIRGDAETRFVILGFAMAGGAEVARIEVSTDLDGTQAFRRTWHQAMITGQSVPPGSGLPGVTTGRALHQDATR